MAGDPRVLKLLEEMLETGRTPEEVCRDCPELLSEVRERWRQFGPIDAEVGALFPEPGTPSDTQTLRPFEPEQPIAARPVGLMKRVALKVLRHPALAMAVATSLLLLLVLIVLGLRWKR